jgi:hypothetical protein
MKSQREEEGWLGPVRAVVFEMADFHEEGGTEILGPRMTLYTIRYDVKGDRVGEVTYNSIHGESRADDYIESSDGKSNVRELSYRPDGEHRYKVISTYENDKIVEEIYYDVEGVPRYKREHRYDLRGQPVEMIYSESGGMIVNKLRYDNEYDSQGNLTKVTIFKWSTSNGKSCYKPISVHFQNISYY